MKMNWTLALMLSLAFPLTSGFSQTARADQEWEQDTPYYEDDAWYDVSEWLDGNDYNPTDEQVGQWDDESWQESDEVEGISDNDRGVGLGQNYDVDNYDGDGFASDGLYDDSNETYTSYGYDDYYNNDDWFYDYYDEGYASYNDLDDDGLYDYSYRYYDYDNDGTYDAFTSYTDWDDDGLYDDYNYYSFNERGTNQQKQQAKNQADKTGYRQSVTGTITSKKRSSVRDTRHLIVGIERDQGNRVIADLGPVTELDQLDLALGDRINVKGPLSQVGNKKVLIAQHIRSQGDQADIYRQRRTYEGQVTNTHETTIRGKTHLIAMLETNRGGRERAVDLGAADKLPTRIHKGVKLTVEGAPVQVRDMTLVMAQSINQDGEEIKIDRRSQQSSQNRDSRQRTTQNDRRSSTNRSR
jgi:hypothetical protein